ncbi:MAG: hypothetical protein FWD46_04380 [Cystobacterineae bacterium]|nr:hypothetical protein [Cystobacterineae bacterium]
MACMALLTACPETICCAIPPPECTVGDDNDTCTEGRICVSEWEDSERGICKWEQSDCVRSNYSDACAEGEVCVVLKGGFRDGMCMPVETGRLSECRVGDDAHACEEGETCMPMAEGFDKGFCIPEPKEPEVIACSAENPCLGDDEMCLNGFCRITCSKDKHCPTNSYVCISGICILECGTV